MRLALALAVLVASACRSTPTSVTAPLASSAASASAPSNVASSSSSPAPSPPLPSSLSVLTAIADDFEALAATCPQLAEFHSATALQPDDLSFSYAFHTHSPTHRGGWTSGVPEPDPDGLWFYVDLHDAHSMSQIDTQPVVGKLDVLGKKLMMLVLEGSAAKPGCVGAMHAILGKRAAQADPCGSPRDEGAAAEATSLSLAMDDLLAAPFGGRRRTGRFTTEGWVQVCHHCNPCPPGASCKPCEEQVWISPVAGAYKDPLERDQNLVVRVPDATRLPMLTHVRVTVAACDFSTAQDAPLQTELRGSVTLPR